MQANTENEALFNAAANIGRAQANPQPDGRPYIVVPEGYRIEFLDETLDAPRQKGTVKLRDAASFVDYFDRFADEHSQIYATLQPAKFIAVLDEHHGTDRRIEETTPRHREFRAEFVVPASEEWKRWTGKDRHAMDQLGFAELLEDNLPDIVEPAGHDLLDMAMNFEVSKTGSFRSVQRLRDGSVNLSWIDETKPSGDMGSGTMTVPPAFKLSIPVFENDDLYEIDARLKYRVKDGKLAIWYELVRSHKALDAAFRVIWAKIAEGTARTILLGTPE